ncbi:putative secondary alcohol dehydrogenase protein [Phaeoacremonium minimum UCRPA7]|uniref:Putative secondary alcohol dehydrogenase protein n=1 Tax=Phaeoacremonium minimum (strain UCR-PA7) TaxID=1286976 RepID=R8BS45_PHAM7|nr:putative secondary alcohol dehydrogenase protein [Phaeoacremonium minimum UCRPA7]EOO02115.1 putative secondary alcohol dehydrogenase protein [Phaeoacremonium minimum UCRPA7]
MSADTLPISPARFAEALKDLSLSSLHLKVLEIRNSIAHLDYSNEQLRPFAEGTEAVLDVAGGASRPGVPDQDCLDAIRENEAVIEKMQERIRLVRVEVEGRGVSWTEFQSKEEAEAAAAAAAVAAARTNGVNGHGEDDATQTASPERQHSAWADGTFQTGVIRNGEVQMDAQAGQRVQPGQAAAGTGGGRLTDEELRRMLEERLNHQDDDDDEEEGGMHL